MGWSYMFGYSPQGEKLKPKHTTKEQRRDGWNNNESSSGHFRGGVSIRQTLETRMDETYCLGTDVTLWKMCCCLKNSCLGHGTPGQSAGTVLAPVNNVDGQRENHHLQGQSKCTSNSDSLLEWQGSRASLKHSCAVWEPESQILDHSLFGTAPCMEY